jgi:hypothetical protein
VDEPMTTTLMEAVWALNVEQKPMMRQISPVHVNFFIDYKL